MSVSVSRTVLDREKVRLNLKGRTVQITDAGHVFYGLFVVVQEDFGDQLRCRPVNSKDALNLAPNQIRRVAGV